MSAWTQSEAIELCRRIEAHCPKFGCHVALTGGLLYKDGERKDCDILFYRIRQWGEINLEGLWEYLESIGVHRVTGFGWCFKATYNQKPIDCFFPEEQALPGEPEYGEENQEAKMEEAESA